MKLFQHEILAYGKLLCKNYNNTSSEPPWSLKFTTGYHQILFWIIPHVDNFMNKVAMHS